MLHPHSYDIAIIGGGLAGLSLAAELSHEQFSSLSIIILEPREVYNRDKTWSYWRGHPHDYSEFEAATWPAWRLTQVKNNMQNPNSTQDKVRNGVCNEVVVHQHLAENYCYASISSDAFYQAALSKIKACKHVQLLQGELVESLRTEAGFAIIALKSAQNIVVKQTIFDSRPASNPKADAKTTHLTQHFLGLELSTDSEVFDVNCIELMDFQSSDHGIHFMYVLPYTKSRALIESTWICAHTKHSDYTRELNLYLTTRWPDAQFKINYTEAGSLPLRNVTTREDWLGNVQIIPIGSAAGTARGATGYAFLETLADSKRLARLIDEKKRLTAFKRNKIDVLMDKLFLSFLAENASLGPSYFMQMFANCTPPSLIRFLSGQANWCDRLNVVLSMPSLPMLKHLLHLSRR